MLPLCSKEEVEHERFRPCHFRSQEGAMDIEKILEEYRNGDECERLRLFLAFRDLRDYFSRIDRESADDDSFVRFPWNKRHRVARAA